MIEGDGFIMKLSKEYILNNLAREDLWKPGSKGTFTYGDWLLTLKREDDLYSPYKFAIEGRKEIFSKALTYETWSRRYVSMEKAFLHILNHFNENANVKDKYDHIDFDVLSSIKDLPSVSFENPTIALDFGNIVSELESKNLRLLHIEDNPGLFVVDSKDNLYAIETYHAGGYLDKYIGEKHIISFEQVEHPVKNFEEWRKTYWDAAWVKDFIKRIVHINYPNVKFDGINETGLDLFQQEQEKKTSLTEQIDSAANRVGNNNVVTENESMNESKSLMLWANDFKNERDWVALCKALDLAEDTKEIELRCNVCVAKSHYTHLSRLDDQLAAAEQKAGTLEPEPKHNTIER